MHFGQKMTSANEGAHAQLKEYLLNSSGDLLIVVGKAHIKIQNEIYELKAVIACEFIQKPAYILNNPLFSEIINRVTVVALKLIYAQWVKNCDFPNGITVCTGFYERNMGLPCSYKLSTLLTNQRRIQISNVHSHWWFFRSGDRHSPQQIDLLSAHLRQGALWRQENPCGSHRDVGGPRRMISQ